MIVSIYLITDLPVVYPFTVTFLRENIMREFVPFFAYRLVVVAKMNAVTRGFGDTPSVVVWRGVTESRAFGGRESILYASCSFKSAENNTVTSSYM